VAGTVPLAQPFSPPARPSIKIYRLANCFALDGPVRGRNSTCVNNGMTGARACVRPCESDTIHRHERACHRTTADMRKVQENERKREAARWMWRRGTDRSDHRYSKLAVCATLINKKSLNFPRRAERKSGTILFPRIDVLGLHPQVYIFSPSGRDTYYSTCDTWPSLTSASRLRTDG